MPPEAFEGKTDARSDVYSLGLTLYEMLAFRPAFDEKERNRLIRQVTQEEPARLGQSEPARAARPGDDRPQGDRPRSGAAGFCRGGHGGFVLWKLVASAAAGRANSGLCWSRCVMV